MQKLPIIYYINLKRRSDRNLEFLSEIQKISPDPTRLFRFEAVDVPGRGHLGCTMSHIGVLECFLKTEENTCLVFEDDFQFTEASTFREALQKVLDDKIPFDIIQLSHNIRKSNSSPYSYLDKPMECFTSSGYWITRNFAEILIQNLKEGLISAIEEEKITNCKSSLFTLDVHWSKLMPDYNWYCYIPRLGIQRASYSDIDFQFVNHGV